MIRRRSATKSRRLARRKQQLGATLLGLVAVTVWLTPASARRIRANVVYANSDTPALGDARLRQMRHDLARQQVSFRWFPALTSSQMVDAAATADILVAMNPLGGGPLPGELLHLPRLKVVQAPGKGMDAHLPLQCAARQTRHQLRFGNLDSATTGGVAEMALAQAAVLRYGLRDHIGCAVLGPWQNSGQVSFAPDDLLSFAHTRLALDPKLLADEGLTTNARRLGYSVVELQSDADISVLHDGGALTISMFGLRWAIRPAVASRNAPRQTDQILTAVMAISKGLLQPGSTELSFADAPLAHPPGLRGQQLGIIGMGQIGGHLAQLSEAFDMRVVTLERPNSRSAGRPAQANATGAANHYDRVPLDELLYDSDVVVTSCPLDVNTAGLLGRDQVQRLKSGATVVNPGRGGLIDYEALVARARRGELTVGTDVLPREPPTDGDIALFARSGNMLVTSHRAWATRQARDDLARSLEQAILNWVDLLEHEGRL